MFSSGDHEPENTALRDFHWDRRHAISRIGYLSIFLMMPIDIFRFLWRFERSGHIWFHTNIRTYKIMLIDKIKNKLKIVNRPSWDAIGRLTGNLWPRCFPVRGRHWKHYLPNTSLLIYLPTYYLLLLFFYIITLLPRLKKSTRRDCLSKS